MALHYFVIKTAFRRYTICILSQAPCNLDVNLKLFDVLGRLAMDGIWFYWEMNSAGKDKKEMREKVQFFSDAVKRLINNNPVLFLPAKDDQAIDISIALLLLSIDKNNFNDVKEWLSELVARATFAYKVNGQYPCNLLSYIELLEHPTQNNENYYRKVTGGSILFPIIALYASLLNDSNLYSQVQSLKKSHLSHCNFQFWYPDEYSEEHFYTHSDLHGAVLSNACIYRSSNDFKNQVFTECHHTKYYEELTAVKYDFWPLILVACRHHRIPVPLNIVEKLCNNECKTNSKAIN